jgi:hypothetical protein
MKLKLKLAGGLGGGNKRTGRADLVQDVTSFPSWKSGPGSESGLGARDSVISDAPSPQLSKQRDGKS